MILFHHFVGCLWERKGGVNRRYMCFSSLRLDKAQDLATTAMVLVKNLHTFRLVGGLVNIFYFPQNWVAVIIPIDVHIFQRGGPGPPTSRPRDPLRAVHFALRLAVLCGWLLAFWQLHEFGPYAFRISTMTKPWDSEHIKTSGATS